MEKLSRAFFGFLFANFGGVRRCPWRASAASIMARGMLNAINLFEFEFYRNVCIFLCCETRSFSSRSARISLGQSALGSVTRALVSKYIKPISA
jgi:hypothetical protein